MSIKDQFHKTWSAIERFTNVIGAAASAIALAIALVATLTGYWDWRTAFFILTIITVICIAVAFYGYRSRVAVHMFTGISKAERMCEADQYAAQRISEAKHSVWDFAWQDDKESNPKTDPPAAVRSAGAKALDEAIRSAIIGGAIHYHEILTTKAYSHLLRKHLGYCRELPPLRTLKYRARIYDNTRRGYRKFPKIQFVVIDEEEVIFMSSGYEYCFSMKSKKTASAFVKYAVMAWDQADEWMKGIKDIVLDGKIVAGVDQYLDEVCSRIDSGRGAA